jgi:hypothetical protein
MQAAAAVMDVDEEEKDIFQMIGERLPSTTGEDQPADEPEEPDQEPEAQIDEENDPQQLNPPDASSTVLLYPFVTFSTSFWPVDLLLNSGWLIPTPK